MSECHNFLFEGLPVRGVLVRLTDAWVEILRRHRTGTAQAYPLPVQNLLGEMVVAATLMHSNTKFNGSLVFQIVGDGPVKLAVVEVQPDLGLRATAVITTEVADGASLSMLVNANNQGKCAITLEPKGDTPGQKSYQGVVSLSDHVNRKLEHLSDMLTHYMLQSEQLDTTLVLAADDKVAAGLLIQRLPSAGVGNLAGRQERSSREDQSDIDQHYQRIAMLASSLRREELLALDAETILRRLFWQEKLLRLESMAGDATPHFSCTCSRERVRKTILGLGADEAQSIVAERGEIEVGCDFCGAQYRFDPIDVTQIFSQTDAFPPSSTAVQ